MEERAERLTHLLRVSLQEIVGFAVFGHPVIVERVHVQRVALHNITCKRPE